MKTLIRGAEIWVPDADGYLLEFGSAIYGDAPEFGAISRSMCFGRGEGLPGRAWEEGRPVVLADLQGGHFQRAAAAKAAGLGCAVAFPVYVGDLLKAVVVLFGEAREGLSGAFELWHNDPRVTSDLTLLEGAYGTRNAAFEAASRDTFLPRGIGLIGAAWACKGAVFMADMAQSDRFVRSAELAATDIRRGLAMACPVPVNASYVLAFLAAPQWPIARRMESWVAGADPQGLRRAWGFDETAGPLPAEERDAAALDPAVLQAFAGGVPRTGEQSLLALPIGGDGGSVTEVLALTF